MTLRTSDVTGSTTSKRAVVAVYDILGFCNQTFQGADRIASALDAIVLMPDFFKGEPLPGDIFPPDTDEKKKIAGDFMQGKANVPMTVGKLNELVLEAKGKHTNAESWGVYGLCWGGKVGLCSLEEKRDSVNAWASTY